MSSIKRIYMPGLKNVEFLNGYSRGYHMAMQNVDADLYLTFCDELGKEPYILTKEALSLLKGGLKGPITAVPIDAASAACLTDEVLTSSEVAAFLK